MKRHSGEHGRYCFKVALMKEKKIKYVQELLIIAYSKKRAQIESIVIYRKNKSKKHNNISRRNIKFMRFEIWNVSKIWVC